MTTNCNGKATSVTGNLVEGCSCACMGRVLWVQLQRVCDQLRRIPELRGGSLWARQLQQPRLSSRGDSGHWVRLHMLARFLWFILQHVL